MNNQEDRNKTKTNGIISRRDFLKFSGIVVIGAGVNGFAVSDGVAGIAACEGYLLVDTKKCQGCMTCMLACSLVHEGKENLSLARIQVLQNPFEKFPDDITLAQCRQCVSPACVEVCPTGALYADSRNGNVRKVDQDNCIGCKACINACPYEPGRSIWNFQGSYAQKCDLCADSGFWNEQGGPNGKQACVEACPVKAIQFTARIPVQEGDDGYGVNLRGEGWRTLGYPVD